MEIKKKVYLSGRMSGLEEEEFKAIFKRAEEELVEKGYDVVNPCEIDYIPEEYGGQLLIALGELAKCDAIYLLENWKESNGARCEYWFAKGMGLEIMSYYGDVDEEVQELESLIETANDRLTELMSDETDMKNSTYKLLGKAKEYTDYITWVDGEITDFVEDFMWFSRYETVDYEDVLSMMDDELDDGNLKKERYDTILKCIYEDAKNGIAGFKYDW